MHSSCYISCSSQFSHPPIACQITLVLSGIQMVEGGIAEKFPDEWDLQFLGNSIINQLSSGISPDFLIERYIYINFFFYFIIIIFFFEVLFYYEDLNLLLEFYICLQKFPVNLFSGFFFPSSPGKLF